MTSRSEDIWGATACGFTLGVVACAMAVQYGGLKDAAPNMRIQAVELGYAEWVVSPDGSTEFKWKDGK